MIHCSEAHAEKSCRMRLQQSSTLLLDVTRSTCLTNTELMRILDGSAPLDAAEQVDDRLDQCQDCFFLLVSLVKALPGDDTKEDFGV